MNTTPPRPHPVIRNIHVTDLVRYRLPLPGIVSIMHRASGALLFLLLPPALWLFDLSLTSEMSFERLHRIGSFWLVKLVLIGLGWALLHHLCAGVRYLFLDLDVGVGLPSARRSAKLVLAVSLPLTALLALFVFGVL